MKLVIVKYNAGNIQSVLYALERIGEEAIVTDDHTLIRNADKVIFPGVGEASSAMKYLEERGLDIVLKNLEQPVLGICLGMQLMCSYSEENDTKCLGIFEEPVKWFFIFSRYSAAVSHSPIEPKMLGSIVFFITATHFLLALFHYVFLRS